MLCSDCSKLISEREIYTNEDKRAFEDCAIKSGLYPLGHTGLRRTKSLRKDGVLPSRSMTKINLSNQSLHTTKVSVINLLSKNCRYCKHLCIIDRPLQIVISDYDTPFLKKMGLHLLIAGWPIFCDIFLHITS
jgi:hypothetical protein